MIQLPNFPFRDQLHDIPSADGKPSENASENCVPTCLVACIQYFTGQRVAADDIKDVVYGQGHIGGGAAVAYGPLLRSKYGLNVGYTPLPSASQAIIDHIRAELQQGHPTIVTMHSQWSRLWNSDQGDGLHVGVAYAISETDSGVLHIMNPWRGFDHVQPVTWWRDRLGNGVWPVSKIASTSNGNGDPVLPAGYIWDSAKGTLTAPNHVVMVGGIAAKVKADLELGIWQAGYPDGPEFKVADAQGELVAEAFGSATLLWRPGWPAPRYASDAEMSALIGQLAPGKAA